MSVVTIYKPEPVDFIADGAFGEQMTTLERELAAAQRFVDAGIDPPTRLLFSGPSGTGKTLAARWIGARLRKSVAVAAIAEIGGGKMGDARRNLAACFEEARRASAILLLDEVDVICPNRADLGGGSADVEDGATTSAFFQLVDALPPAAILIAATNFPDDLDPALRRRLTVEVDFPLPDCAARRRMLGQWLSRAPLPEDVLDAIAEQTEGLSGAELRARGMAAARRAVLMLPAERPKAERATDSVERAQVILRLLEGA